jgi:recombination protein RecT
MANKPTTPATQPASDPNTAIAPQKTELSEADRFTNMVMKQYGSLGTPYVFTQREKQLIRNYFICIDQMLQRTEAERLRKNNSNSDHKYDNNLAYSWKTIDLPQLAQDLAHYARVGLDMMEDNSLFPIPYKSTKGNMYTITLMEGYNGIRLQAEKYALDPFKAVTVEVIFENDVFKPIKKDARNPVEGYEFDIPQPFNRGLPVGVFGYIEFDDPAKNKLVVFSKEDVMKRKPKYASPEFWGGEKTVYEKGKPVRTQLEGWLPEMYEKTMKREIYGSKRIPRDPAKIDDAYNYIRQREQQYVDIITDAEVSELGNAAPVALPEAPVIEVPDNPPAPPQEPPVTDKPAEPDDEDVPDFLK